ncbi:SpoIIE family protein phosphatase [Streptomyces sp. NBC_01498]|uniref:SpoIIE family protein phosphatase n=1 Tax=Streptomyces sp. NBC_01498 TaxID=2975870 RepID=UPI002E7BE219|nr:SpoIIE family protein phosphatase [Streptomyces sp. NBC_01498]WTL28559.1 SpoIIE family protein phosphatase [Streptomyces sp. NBC_01498]
MAAQAPRPGIPGTANAHTAVNTAAALHGLVNGSGLGLAVWDTGLRCVWANEALTGYDGIPVAARLGRPPREALAGDADDTETTVRRVLATGAPVTGREFRVPTTGGQGDRHGVLSASYLRLDDADGRPLGVCLLVLPVGGRWWAGDRLAVVSEAGARIGTSLDVMRTAQELADFTVPLIADYVTVDLTEAVRLGEEPLERFGPSRGRVPTFRRAGRASIHTGSPESLWGSGEVVYVPEDSPFMEVLASGRPVLQPLLDADHDAWLEKDPARAEKIREFGMHSLLIVPVQARGVLLGVAVFVRTRNPTPFDESDELLAEELVARAALTLDNARRYTRERTAALALQHSLLPRRVSGGRAMDVATRYLPADDEYNVGGDWFDVIGLPGGRLALVVGDVVGHGINAAATMGRLRTAIRTLADLDLPPGELLTRLDRTFVGLAEENDDDGAATEPSPGATCAYAVYEPATRTCTVALAGHPPPAVVDPDGGVTFPDLPHGTSLGVALLPYESGEVRLPENGVIAFYTDGLVEDRRHDIDIGMARLSDALGRRAASLEELCAAVIDTLPTTTPADDVTLLLARDRRDRPPAADPPAPPGADLPLPPTGPTGDVSCRPGRHVDG